MDAQGRSLGWAADGPVPGSRREVDAGVDGTDADDSGTGAGGTGTGGLDAARQELATILERMEQLRKEAAVAVEAAWQTRWRNDEVFAIKVNARLTGQQEYRELVDRARAAEAAVAAAEATG